MPRARRPVSGTPNDPTRRDFMRAAGCAALTTTSIISTIWDLRMVNAATADRLTLSALAPGDDYKALVCIFMFGGNDANNMIVPTDPTRWGQYNTARGNLALPQASLLGLNLAVPDPAGTYGFHPAFKGLRNDVNGVAKDTGLWTLFHEGKVASLANVGTLVYPITRAQYQAKTVPVPQQLFSHNDQQVQWQTSVPDQPSRTGWGGRCADLLYSMNGNATVSMSISLSGSNTFEVGNVINQLNVSSTGAVALASTMSAAQKAAMVDILNMAHPNLYENAFATITDRAIDSADIINTAIAPTAAANYWQMPFLNNTLGNQLKMIARIIAARTTLGHSRQIFFASIGGYDLHSGQVNAADHTLGSHANLFTELSEGMFSFQRAMEQLGVANNVVSFTMSDFGRTFPTNGAGSDHGWGNHQLVMGGSGNIDPLDPGIVAGQQVYGAFPELQVNGPNDTSTGRWIPTTAVDQYSATLARWFGVTEGDLPTVFPNIGRFATSDLGFINTPVPAAVPVRRIGVPVRRPMTP